MPRRALDSAVELFSEPLTSAVLDNIFATAVRVLISEKKFDRLLIVKCE